MVNPCSLILSAVMMLEYFGWQEAADVIEKALEESFADGRATNDLARFMPGGKALPPGFAKEITEKIQRNNNPKTMNHMKRVYYIQTF